MICTNCETLRDEVATLKRRLGDTVRHGDMAKLALAKDLSPGESRILLMLYYAKDWVPTERLTYGLDTSKEAVRTMVYRIRGILGDECLENRWGIGYRLSDSGLQTMESVLG